MSTTENSILLLTTIVGVASSDIERGRERTSYFKKLERDTDRKLTENVKYALK